MNKPFSELSIDEQVHLIEDVLENQVYPYLRSHGGGMEVVDIDGTDVLIRYYGVCGGCPISEDATLEFIESVLQSQIDSEIRVLIHPDFQAPAEIEFPYPPEP